MAVRVTFYGFGNGQTHVPDGGFLVALDGRQAIAEGPRRVGFCVECNGLCMGNTRGCFSRVRDDAKALLREQARGGKP